MMKLSLLLMKNAMLASGALPGLEFEACERSSRNGCILGFLS